MSEARGEAAGAALLRPLCLIGLFAGAGLLFAFLLWPLTLRPFWTVWRASLPLALAVALLPPLEGALRPRVGRFVFAPATAVGAGLVALILAGLIALVHVVLIRLDPYLMLSQFLREELWLLWLLALPQAFACALLLMLWERLEAGRPRA